MTIKKKLWVQNVTTVSTFPPPGTFTKPAEEIAEIMSRKDVSPKGLASGLRMIVYYKNRAGKKLGPERTRELDKAIRLMSGKVREEKASSWTTKTLKSNR